MTASNVYEIAKQFKSHYLAVLEMRGVQII